MESLASVSERWKISIEVCFFLWVYDIISTGLYLGYRFYTGCFILGNHMFLTAMLFAACWERKWIRLIWIAFASVYIFFVESEEDLIFKQPHDNGIIPDNYFRKISIWQKILSNNKCFIMEKKWKRSTCMENCSI